jgi:hypothetical protein
MDAHGAGIAPLDGYRLVSRPVMRRCVTHRVFAIVLVLTRLVLGDFMHLPAAGAAVQEAAPAKMTMMMGGEPCAGMAGMPTDHPGHPVPGNDGTCCKSSQCPCLHAPALMVALQMPAEFSISYAEVWAAPVHVIGDPPAVFFRPPI